MRFLIKNGVRPLSKLTTRFIIKFEGAQVHSTSFKMLQIEKNNTEFILHIFKTLQKHNLCDSKHFLTT